MPTIAYTALGTHLLVNGKNLAQCQSAAWDHTLGRLRVRLIYWGEDDGQESVRALRAGVFVDLRLEMPDGIVRECKAVVRFCRTRFSLHQAIRTTLEFTIDEEQFALVGRKDQPEKEQPE